MEKQLSDRICEKVEEAGSLYHRLVMVVGPPRTGKTIAFRTLASSRGWPHININLRLSERLLPLTRKKRALRFARCLEDLVAEMEADPVMLDNIELLFSPEFSQDPLRLLQGLGRHRTVIVNWPGAFDGSYLTYADPGHVEARRYQAPEALIVPVVKHGSGNPE